MLLPLLAVTAPPCMSMVVLAVQGLREGSVGRAIFDHVEGGIAT